MSTKTSIKRIALVAVSALGFGLLSSVAPAKAAAVTGTVSPVRVTLTGGVQDTTPTAKLSWTTSAALNGNETAVLTLTTAPSAAARVKIDVAGNIGSAIAAFDTAGTNGSAKLGTPSAAITLTGQSASAGDTTSIAIQADTVGYFAGSVAVWDAGASAVDTVSFSFTTTGAVASYTFTSNVTETSPAGAITTTTTLLDANGNATQPLTVDSVALSDGTADGTFATATLNATGSGASSLFDGVATSVYTNVSTAAGSATLTATPAGTLGTLAAKTIAVTTNSTTIDATAVTAYTAVTPSNAAAQTGTLAGGDRAQAVPTGTSSISYTVTGPVSKTIRFSVVASAGTVDGTAYTTTSYYNVATSSTGAGTLSFTLGGAATTVGATVTINQVTVQNVAVANTQLVVTQTNGAVSASTPTFDISGALVRSIGTSTNVTVTIADQYGTALGSGFVVRAYRTSVSAANLLDTQTTGAAGTATLAVTNVSGITSGTAESYVFTYTSPGAASAVTITTTGPTITYTTAGTITSLSVAISGTTGSTSPVTDTTLASAVTTYPAVLVPTDGTANDASGSMIYTVADGTVTGAATAEVITLTATATPGNTVTYTADAGSFLSSTASKAWNAGVSSLTVANTTAAYVFATKTGLHTITATSGGKTATIKFWAYNLATDYYTVSAAADSTSLTTGGNGVITATVNDIFGNAVDTTGSLLTATAANKVRLAGQALTQAFDTGADGTFQFTVVADGAAGSGTIAIAPTTTGANAWLSTYTAPTGASAPVSSVTLTYTVSGATVKTAQDAYDAAVVAQTKADAAKDAATTAGTKADAAKAEAALATTAATTAGTKADDAKAEAAKSTAQGVANAAAIKAVADALTAFITSQTAANADMKASNTATAAALAALADAVQNAIDAANEATDAANAATDAASAAAEAADAATAAAQDASDAIAGATDAATAAGDAAASAQDSADASTDAANAAVDAANAAAESADAATEAANAATDAATAAGDKASEALAAVTALSSQLAAFATAVNAKMTALTNLVVKIQKKVKA